MPIGTIDEKGIFSPSVTPQKPEDNTDVGYLDIIGATFRTENTVGSFFNQEDNMPSLQTAVISDTINGVEGQKNWRKMAIDDPEIDNTHLDRFETVRRENEYHALKKQITKENNDREFISKASGTTQFMAGLTAGVIDLDVTTLIPVLKPAKIASKAGTAALNVASGAAIGAAASVSSEALLKQTQVTRDDDYYASLVGGAIFGGALGGGAMAIRKILDTSSIERSIGKQAINEFDDGNAAAFGNSSASAAQSKVITTVEDEGLAGSDFALKAAKIASKDKVFLDNPVLQSLVSPFKATRQIAQQLAETSGMRIKKTEQGLPVAEGLPAIESLNKLSRGALAETQILSKDLWTEFVTGETKGMIGRGVLEVQSAFDKTKMSYRDFQKEVGTAMMNGDVHEIPQVQKMAQSYRQKIFEPIKERAIKLDLLPEGVTPDTAASYFTRMYDIDAIVRNSDEFDATTAKWLSEQQQAKAQIQDEITPLYEQYSTLKNTIKDSDKKLTGREKTTDTIQTQLNEGFKYLKDIRSRKNVGKKLVDNAQNKYDFLKSQISEMEATSDTLIDSMNTGLKEKLPELNEKLERLFTSKKQSLSDKKTFDKVLKKAANQKEKFEPKVKYPVLHFLKGNIHPDGNFAKSLRGMDITPQTMPGYFSKNGLKEIDNIPWNEYPELAEKLDKTPNDLYFEPQELIDAIDSELRGDPIIYADKDVAGFEAWQETQNFKAKLQSRGIDLDDTENAFDAYQQSKQQDDAFTGDDDPELRSLNDLEQEIDDIEFYERATELLPSLRNDLNDAIAKINKTPALKKLGLDKSLRELNDAFKQIETDLAKTRNKIPNAKGQIDKQAKDFSLKTKERDVIDRQATKRAKNKLSALLSKKQQAQILKRTKTDAEYNVNILREKLENLAGKWQGKSSKELKSLMAKEAQGKQLDDAFDDAIKRMIGTETRLIDSELKALAGEIRNRIVSTPDGRLPYERDLQVDGNSNVTSKGFLDDSAKPGMFKGRAFMIEDNKIAKFLIRDADAVSSAYVHKTSPYMNMVERFEGDTELTQVRLDLQNEKEIALREYEGDTSKEAGDARERIEKQYSNDVKSIIALRQRALGQDTISGDPTSLGTRIPQAVRTYNVITLLGGMTISAIPDLGRLITANSSVLNKAVMPIVKNLVSGDKKIVGKKFRENTYFGTVVELVANNRMMQIGDITDDIQPRTKLERAIQYMGDKTGIVTLMSAWNESLKQVAAIASEAAVLDIAAKLANGTATKAEIATLAQNRLDVDTAKRILDQYNKHGEEHKGLKILNLQNWDDTEVRTKFNASIVEEVDRIILTPGYDKSVNMTSSELKKLMWQFKSFFAKSTTNILIRGLQDIKDPKNAAQFLTMTGLGMMIYATKTLQADRELSDNPAVWLIEGFDRAGIGGIFMEANNITEKAMGVGMRPIVGGDVASRYQSRSAADSLMGPTLGQMNNIAQLARVLGTGEISNSDINTAIRMIPFQNHPLLAYPKNRLKEALDQ